MRRHAPGCIAARPIAPHVARQWARARNQAPMRTLPKAAARWHLCSRLTGPSSEDRFGRCPCCKAGGLVYAYGEAGGQAGGQAQRMQFGRREGHKGATAAPIVARPFSGGQRGQPGAAHGDVAAGPGLPQLVRPHQLPGPCRLACTYHQLQLPHLLLFTSRLNVSCIKRSMQRAAS